MKNRQQEQDRAVRRTVIRTGAALIGMFAFALVPLYDVFCQITGLNGKVSTSAQQMTSQGVDENRYVTVQFITRGSAGLPWKMDIATQQVRLHPGQVTEVDFVFTNYSEQESWGRAVPSVSPSRASQYLRKINCFCFDKQMLKANEKLKLPLIFQLVRDLPQDINTVTLVYTLYPVDEKDISFVYGYLDQKGEMI
ncbi:cytochrome c oxidase assembly protein [Vreelandella massiliensis]|uniref:cytochrome c oxidase assembly protein n=1 Tax=Vreelandella massiliensis TaxID=1816686 RepID=UPI00096A75D7|nr:cytochrome c oxidase assembly protein [Halomonas massiliensis]